MTISQTIYELRHEAGLTQEQLASQLGVSRQAVSKWENGAALPDIDNIAALCKIFNISSDRFVLPCIDSIDNTSNWDAEIINNNSIPKKDHHKVLTIAFKIFIWLVALFSPLCVMSQYLLNKIGYMFNHPLFISIMISILAILQIGAFSYLKFKKKSKSIILMVICMIVSVVSCGCLWWSYTVDVGKFTFYRSVAPESKMAVVLKLNNSTKETTYYRRRNILLSKKVENLPHTLNGEPKLQWLTSDVCAITYNSSDDGAMHQYIATFDTRDKIGYKYVINSIIGNWSGATEETKDWKIISADGRDGGLTISIKGREEFFNFDDCVQFGTTAVVLCRNGLPRWTLALNEDCYYEPGYDLVAAGGTITLAQVAESETPAFIFNCDDDIQKKKQQTGHDIYETPKDKISHETIAGMQRVAKEKYIEEEALPEGVKLFNSFNNDIPWIIFLSSVECDNLYKGQNGTDVWSRLDNVELISGNEKDGCWKYTITERATVPGNQGSKPTFGEISGDYYIRIIQTINGDYLCYSSTFDLSFGLSKTNTAAVDLIGKDAYHRFIPGDYSSDDWRIYNDRLSPEEAATWIYEKQFKKDYPNAQVITDDARGGFKLDNQTYLIYDGIWDDNGKWVYHFWCYKTTEKDFTKWNGNVTTVGFYNVDFNAYKK